MIWTNTGEGEQDLRLKHVVSVGVLKDGKSLANLQQRLDFAQDFLPEEGSFAASLIATASDQLKPQTFPFDDSETWSRRCGTHLMHCR